MELFAGLPAMAYVPTAAERGGDYGAFTGILLDPLAFEEARRIYDQLIRERPELPQPHVARGTVWAAVGDLDRAITAYEQALRIDPKSASARDNLALAYATRREADGAFSYGRKTSP